MPQFFVVSKSTEPRSELTDSKGAAFEYPRTGASLDETEISTIIKISKIDERSFKINVWRSLIGYGRNFGCKYSIMICKTLLLAFMIFREGGVQTGGRIH